MAIEKKVETPLSSSFFKEINGLPVIQVAGDIYSSAKKRYWLLSTGLTAAEHGLSGLFGRLSYTLGIAQRVDELAGESVCRLKEKYPSLHQSPEELKSKASSSFRSAVRFAVKTPPGRLLVSGLDLVIGATDSAAALLNTRDKWDRKCSPRPIDDQKDELSDEGGAEKKPSDKSLQTSPAFPKSVVFNIRCYVRDFLTYVVNRLKYVRRYICGRKKRISRGSMSPDKEREIEARRKVSPRKKVSASLLGRLTQKTFRLLGLDSTGRIGLDGKSSLVAGSADAEKKRKHDEIVSEDGSDDDLANFDYDNYNSEDDPDYEPTQTEETDETLSDLSAESDLEVEEKDGNFQLKEKTEQKRESDEEAPYPKPEDDERVQPDCEQIRMG
ncbi:uncharacterized protein LOC127881470 isoform X1 [Dreissena polymorpha]|uniref:Uncharacterized protein n=1 Tax=Dreissena polymorpha TaxID=45954 RepID=A0A9D4H4Q6_DREPO|nr:uncharacterized protein LOC127881470 isoform X1 [Dreissena polymorpha]KAH3828237.1 hypothetical protein DPMN_130190 [Dreissena polymorpha]